MAMNRGEIWLINLDPPYGKEMGKRRPAVILNNDGMRGSLDFRIVAPITSWKNHFENLSFFVKIEPNSTNSLNNISGVNVLQLRSIDTKRFMRKLGQLKTEELEEIENALYIVLKLPFRR